MPKQFAHGVKVNAASQAKSSEGVAGTMEGNILVDAGSFYPLSNSLIDTLLCSELENRIRHDLLTILGDTSALTCFLKDRRRLFGNREGFDFASLDLGEFQEQSSRSDIFTFCHVKRCTSEYLRPVKAENRKACLAWSLRARRVCQALQLFQNEILPSRFPLLNGNVRCRVLGKDAIFDGLMAGCLDSRQVNESAVRTYCFEKVILEACRKE